MSRRVLIVGATSAIAQATARCFADEGARLILAARDPEKLRAVADDLRVRGAESVYMVASDLEEDRARGEILAQASRQWQGLDAALIAYGALPDQELCERDPAALRAALETNWTSVAAWLAELAAIFEAQQSGDLAVIGSVAGDRGRRSNYVYGSAKAAVATFAAGLRLRLRGSGARVTLVKPGWVATPMTAHLRRNFLYAQPEQVGRGIYKAMLAGRPVVYLPWYWRGIMLAIRLVPEPLFARMKM